MFTAENAAMYARKSHAPDSARHRPKVAMIQAIPTLQEFADPLASKLARVQDELVNQMQGNTDATEISRLSKALRDVREVFHLVTGQAKPGVIRETGRSSRRQTSKPAPLPDDDTPQAPASVDPGSV